MKEVAKFPGLIKRGNTFSLRTHVPKDLVQTYRRKEILTALKTTDRCEAIKLAKIKAAEFAVDFASRRTIAPGPVAVAANTTVTIQHRRRLAEAYYVERVGDEPLKRRKLLKRARADETAFWNGEIVPTPDDEHSFRGVPHSFWEERCCDGETPLEDAFLYAVNFRDKKALRSLRTQLEIGDCDAFLSHASALAPNASEDDKERLALDLLREEMRALMDIVAKDETRVT